MSNTPYDYLYPERGHDFSFDWEYTVDERVTQDQAELLRTCEENVREILPLLGVFRDFTCTYVTGLRRGIVGCYVDGTVSHPYIAISRRAIERAAAEYDVDIDVATESTIIHELGHALQEALGIDRESPEAEEQAESLSLFWYNHGIIAPEWANLLALAHGK